MQTLIDRPHPRVAVTQDELARLRRAWKADGPEHKIVADVVQRAAQRLDDPLHFPLRGGQHNQWYQCDACQQALETVDDTHHRCPLCSKIYSGPPYDDVIFARRHTANLQRMRDAAWAYAITGEDRFARDAAAVLLGYAKRYAAYPLHSNDGREGDQASRSGGHLFEQTLNEASTVTLRIGPAYDLVYPALQDEDRKIIEQGLIRPTLENLGRHRAGKSNWQTWHNAAMVWGGAVLGDADWVRRGIDDPDHGFRYQMTASITPDGMWYENSWGYHFYALEALVQTAEAARRLGIDLWAQPRLRAMCTLPAEYLMPDGTLPRFADAVDTRLDSPQIRALLALASSACPDAQIDRLLPDGITWETILTDRRTKAAPAPRLASRVLAGTGHAIVRADGPAGLAAALTFGPHGGFHGHFDKLSFVFFGHGRELGVDPGRAVSQAYRLPIHRNWYRATISHNTVIVDGQSQAEATGELELFVQQPSYSAVAVRCTEAYQDVSHRRLLVLTPQYLLVVDDVATGQPRHFTWLYHNRSQNVKSNLAVEPAGVEPTLQGGEYLRDLQRVVTGDPVAACFTDTGLTTHLLLAAAPDTQIDLATGPGGSVEDRVPLLAATRSGRQARFAAILEPVRAGTTPSVKAVTLQETPDAMKLTINRDGPTDTVTWSKGRLDVRTRPQP